MTRGEWQRTEFCPEWCCGHPRAGTWMDEAPPGLCSTEQVSVVGSESLVVMGYQTPRSGGPRVRVMDRNGPGLLLSVELAEQLGAVMGEAMPGLAVAIGEVISAVGGVA